MNTVVEYKMHIDSNGAVIHPPFISNPGWWYKESDKTYVGIILPEAERTYYVPDTLTELSKAEVLQRMKDIHSDRPYVVLPAGTTAMSQQQISDWCDEWWESNVGV